MTRRLRVDWRRIVVYTHRWLGICGCLLFVLWFISGIVMMYTRMPSLAAGERLTWLPGLDLSSARVSPGDAAEHLGLSPASFRVAMLDARPVYRFLEGRRWTTVFADTGELLSPISQSSSLEIARDFLPEHASTVRYEAFLTDSDQWTLGAARGFMPLHRLAVGDDAGTRLYVSALTGDAVMKTTRRERILAYAGAVPHWLYFTPFRRHSAVWAQTVIWLSVAGCVLSLSGLVWGVWRYSVRRRFRLKHEHFHSPYAGMMRWHHYAGLVFGVATFTWIFSGLLSMDPWAWSPGNSPTEQQLEAVTGGAPRLDRLSLPHLRSAASALAESIAVKEVELLQFRGEPYLVAYQASTNPRAGITQRLVSATAPERGAFSHFDREQMLATVLTAMPDSPVRDTAWLENYDAYYYDRRRELPLPVLRVRYDDAKGTWLYADPRRGAIVQKEERVSRLNRWLYHGFHSLDFPFLYYRRPLWDIVVIVLSLGGMTSGITAIVLGARRLRRHARRVSHR